MIWLENFIKLTRCWIFITTGQQIDTIFADDIFQKNESDYVISVQTESRQEVVLSVHWLLRWELVSTLRALSICKNGRTSLVCTSLKGTFYYSPLNFFKIARTIFGVFIFQDFAAPSLQNDTFDLQIGQPVLANGKHSKLIFKVFRFYAIITDVFICLIIICSYSFRS